MSIRHYLRAINAENIKEWKIEITYRADFIRGLFEPLFFVLPALLYGIAIVGGRYSENLENLTGTGNLITYTVIGYLFMGFVETAVWGMGFALRKEQWYGTIEQVFAAPVPRWVYVMGMAVHSTLHQGIIILMQSAVIYGIFSLVLDISGILPSLVIIGVMMISLYGLGILLSSLVLIFKEGWIISEILYSVIIIVTPIAYPLAVLPSILQKISLYMPTTYGITTIRHFLIGEVSSFTIVDAVIRLLIIGAVWVVFGLCIFTIVDNRVRRRGELGTY
jgi:ABC-2 type transport system permease protein